MYQLTDLLAQVKGIGSTATAQLANKNLHTILDLLLWVPLQYSDRSHQKLIQNLILDELVTIQAEVVTITTAYRGRKSIQRAKVRDRSGTLQLIWFNSLYLNNTLKLGQSYFFSGKLNEKKFMVQPIVEKISTNTTHTNRLVPIYPTIGQIKPGNLRRYLKEIIDHLDLIDDSLAIKFNLLSLNKTFQHLHFPDDQLLTIQARKRLALEELLALIHHSWQIKKKWQQKTTSHLIKYQIKNILPNNLPFTLTAAQIKAIQAILADLKSQLPMNRLLLGDVGSGKTIVAAIAAWHVLNNNFRVALIVPTQILAKQHWQTIKQIFPQLKLELLTAKNNHLKKQNIALSQISSTIEPTFYIGTHALINQLNKIQPALIIYDEQHRFGVSQRSQTNKLVFNPHILTMTATPIPRSLMLTIFSHLTLSVIDELPKGRKKLKTWLIPNKKRRDAYQWINQQLAQNNQQNRSQSVHPIDSHNQVLIVCPFINPSPHEPLKNIASATEKYQEIKQQFPNLTVTILHGKQSQSLKDKITHQLFNKQIDILVTTPIIEVGLDLPTASIIVIESAQRYGLASLHQLRGRVGRTNQQGYCLLFTQTTNTHSNKRLSLFTQTADGLKLAEFDLKNRGAGDLFGTEQHGFDQLKFANWTNLELIGQARKIFEELKSQLILNWQPVIKINHDSTTNSPLPN